MRDSFPYESNVPLIRNILVPDPLSGEDWNSVISNWQSLREPLSLLEYLALRWLDENVLLETLGHSLGATIYRNATFKEDGEQDAAEQMLRNHGFQILTDTDGRRLVTGGPTFNPNLRQYLGSDHLHWKWVLVSPVRAQPRYAKREDPVSGISTGGISIWLKTLIGSLWSEGVRDIHFEREDNQLIVRSHMTGGMRIIGKWSDGRASTVTRLLCNWAGIANWNNRSFIDGRLSLPENPGFPSLRLSAIPTVAGESLVLRAPNPALKKADLDKLGVPRELKEVILDVALYHPGMIICTGSTGSGKTTTLYAILNELSCSNLKILTIEDPVEQVIPSAVQSAVDENNGWSFEQAIKAFLRQDPDVIMVGEIRDRKSAEGACRAALTGHCVLTTMHARDEQSAIDRLKSWGLPNGVLAESIRIVINQRLHHKPETATLAAKFSHVKYRQAALPVIT